MDYGLAAFFCTGKRAFFIAAIIHFQQNIFWGSAAQLTFNKWKFPADQTSCVDSVGVQLFPVQIRHELIRLRHQTATWRNLWRFQGITYLTVTDDAFRWKVSALLDLVGGDAFLDWKSCSARRAFILWLLICFHFHGVSWKKSLWPPRQWTLAWIAMGEAASNHVTAEIFLKKEQSTPLGLFAQVMCIRVFSWTSRWPLFSFSTILRPSPEKACIRVGWWKKSLLAWSTITTHSSIRIQMLWSVGCLREFFCFY